MGHADSTFADRQRDLRRAHKRWRGERYRSLLGHWLSRCFVAPAPCAEFSHPEVAPSQVAITYIGHASVLVRYADQSIVVDPMLGNWLGAIHRERSPGLRADQLHNVQTVLITNRDPAHLHLPTLAQLPRTATVIVPPGCAMRVSRLGFSRLMEMRADSVFHSGTTSIFATNASDADALGFAIRGNGPTLYVCGRSGYWPGFADIGKQHNPDIALLPIGGYAPNSFRERHMSPLDALYAFEDLRARIFVPIHHGSFALSYERLADPSRWLAELVRERSLENFVVMLGSGDSRVFTNPSRARRPTPHSFYGDVRNLSAALPL